MYQDTADSLLSLEIRDKISYVWRREKVSLCLQDWLGRKVEQKPDLVEERPYKVYKSSAALITHV
jgi:hypothetical protein